MRISAEDLGRIKEILAMPKKIVIISHRNPDGDAIGSSLALYHALREMNHACTVMFPSEYPANFAWMPDLDKALIYDVQTEECESALTHAEFIFCLDFNSLERIDKAGQFIDTLKCPIMMIDHHIDPMHFAEFEMSFTDASSTAELVYDFLDAADWKRYMTPAVVSSIYTGILTDTGSFRHATNAHLFEIMADLKKRGLDDYRINDLIFNTVPEKNLRLLGHALLNRLEVLPDHRAGIIHLTKEDYQNFDIQRGDTEGIVNYILTLRGIQLAAFITEQPRIVKISLRSKYDVDVQALARDHFKGGGHKNAAGGYTYEPLESAIRRMKKAIPDYIRATVEK